MCKLIRFAFLALLFVCASTFPISLAANSRIEAQVIRKAGVYLSPDGQCEVSLKTSEMGGFLILSAAKKNGQHGPDAINDITGIAWLNGNRLLYTVSPIYGVPGVYLFNCKSMQTRTVLRPRNINKAYSHGADYFELQNVVSGAKGIIYFYYARDVDNVDFEKLRTVNSLYQVNLDGTGFRKVHR